MSGKKDDLRSQRSSALADKKKRLEELKARRSTRQQQQQHHQDEASTTSTTSASEAEKSVAASAGKSGNLDEYIDGLLNSRLPVGAPTVSPYATSATTTLASAGTSNGTIPVAEAIPVSTSSGNEISASSKFPLASVVDGTANAADTNTSPSVVGERAVVVQEPSKTVETFEICTQTNADDFPPPWSNEDDDNDNDNGKQIDNEANEDNVNDKAAQNDISKANDDQDINVEAKLLDKDEVNETISSTKFTSFFNSASKRVERYLGSSILSDLLVDDMMYYTDLHSKRNESSKSSLGKSSHSLVSAQVTFEYPKWTTGRDITSIDWSVHHRGEVMLASYHMSSSSVSSITSTAISSIDPNATRASSLLPRSRSEMTQADGLNIIWNLTMPNRPEHILTCGSPVLESKFHPTEGNLVVGACYSGQVVVWDVRNGRLPVQRSSLNLLGGNKNSSGGGHVHPIVGMEVLDGGAGFVTAASDGTVNFWSLSNLIEPAESLKIPGGNLTSIVIAPESQSIIAGDECGSMYAITSSSSSTSGRGNTSSSSSRRSIRKLNSGSRDPGSNDLGHYGPVTGLSAKVMSKANDASSVSISKGFARGTKGMVLTCGVDWTTKLWGPAYSEKPLLSFLSHSYDYMSDVQWSPIHPTIFATGSSNGSLNLWNLANSLDEPLTGIDGIQVEKNSDSTSQRGINKIQWSADGRRLAVGCADTLHVLAMTDELWKPNGDEESKLMNNLKSRGILDKE